MLVGLVVLEQVFVHETLNTMIIKIENLNTQIDAAQKIDNDIILNTIYEIDKYWTEKENILCLTINHNDLSRVGEQIKRVKVYAEQDQKDDCLCELEALLFFTESYKHVMEITVQNFF